MKELTIEEKAKCYDEALEIARGLYAKDAPDSLHLERMFPILKEDEDEKIRKGLIDYFENLASNKDYRVDKNRTLSVSSIISYLEKQGEQKSMKTCAEYYNQDNELKMPELSEFQDKLADILMYREYDGPDETEDDIAKRRIEYELAAIRLSEELLPLAQKEQKPAWKPSDEQMNLLEELVEDNNQRYFYTILRSLYEQLKKLREE